jgi:AraC family transcriptional regulator
LYTYDMTIYEQIQKAVDFIEKNLFTRLRSGQVARSVYMSSRSFYNYFWAVTGYSFKEYVRKRRLTEAMKILKGSEEKVIFIALNTGYESHEAFSRAFKNEFGVSPIHFREDQGNLDGLEQINLIKEMYMGIVTKKLPRMRVACFEGFSPDPETKAMEKMEKWIKAKHLENKPHRIFGHNIDNQGNLSYDPHNIGYKVLVTIDDDVVMENDEAKEEIIQAGRFLVTGIEGDIESDPEGRWIMEGWQNLNSMIKKKRYTVKQPARWFEEVLEPSKQGNLRLDLYVEIE